MTPFRPKYAANSLNNTMFLEHRKCERTKSDAKEFWISLNNGLCSWNSREPMYFCSLIPNHPTWHRVKMQPWEVMAKKLNWSRDQSKLLFLDDCFRADGVHGLDIELLPTPWRQSTYEIEAVLPPPNFYVAQKAGKTKIAWHFLGVWSSNFQEFR